MKIVIVVAFFFALLHADGACSQTRARAKIDNEKVCAHGAVVDFRVASGSTTSQAVLLGVQTVYTPWASDNDTLYLKRNWFTTSAEPEIALVGIWLHATGAAEMFDSAYDALAGAFAARAPVRILSRTGACYGEAKDFDIKVCGTAPCLDER